MIRRLVPLFATLPLLLLAAAESPAPATPAPPAEQFLSVPEPGRFKTLFQPFRTDSAALSPDGKHLAYSIRDGDALSVVVLEIDHPEVIKARVQVITDEAATPMLALQQREKTPGIIRWMRWVTPTRLVVETNQIHPHHDRMTGQWLNWRGAVLGFDADGRNARRLASPDDLPELTDSDFDGENPFSTRRDNRPLGTRADQPAAAEDDASTLLTTPEEDEERASANPGATQPRTLRVFDFDAARPGAVTLVTSGAPRATGNRSVGFHSLDTNTGKLTELANDLFASTRATLLDRQGIVRLTLPDSLLSRFPFRYEYLGAKGKGRPQPLDQTPGLVGFSVSPDNYFGERSVPLGFAEDPAFLYFASNVGRDTFGIYSVNLTTGERGKLAIENPAYDLINAPESGFPGEETLVFDRFTHDLAGIRYSAQLRTTAWTRPDWQDLQVRFEKMFPGRSVEITDWDEAGNRFLLSTEGPADPGAFYVFDRSTGRLLEFVRRAPWVDEKLTHATLPFSYATPDGARITGLVTVPRQPRLKPVPMVVLCPDQPWLRVRTDFQTEVHALADMGFAVVQLNGRGAWGLGLKQRQSLTAGFDLVQVEDVVTTITSLEKVFNVNLRRVALLGRGHGGFVALRALQTHPDKFRCAIALEAPVDLGDWLASQRWTGGEAQPQLTRAWLGDAARLKAAPLTRAPEQVTRPVLLLNYPGPAGEPHLPTFAAANAFASRVRRAGGPIEFGELHVDYMRGLPAARAEVFDRLEQFLNTHIYDFQVKLKALEIIK